MTGDAIPIPAPLPPIDEDTYARFIDHNAEPLHELLYALDLYDGFVLIPIVCSTAYMAAALAEHLRRKGYTPFTHAPTGDAWMGISRALLSTPAVPGRVVIVYGTSIADSAQARGIHITNLGRDEIVPRLACPLLWCGPADFHDKTWGAMPDFWSVRALHLTLTPPPPPAARINTHVRLPGLTPDDVATTRDLLAAARDQGDVRLASRFALQLLEHHLAQADAPTAAQLIPEINPTILHPDDLWRWHIARAWLALLQRDDDALNALKVDLTTQARNATDLPRRARMWSDLADLVEAQGELDEALSIRQNEELPVYERLGDVRSHAVTIGLVADILVIQGELDSALRIRRDGQLPAFERLGDVRERAITLGQIADILIRRGQLEEALAALQTEVLPVFERLGDARSWAVTLGKIADVLTLRGKLEEALSIRQREQLPIYERLGDIRERAVTLGQIADLLAGQGRLEEALTIRQREQLPIFERLDDVRERAVAQGQIADLLMRCGRIDEALSIRLNEELPVFERLGDVRSLSIGRTQCALNLLLRDAPGDRDEARALLRQARADALRLRLPEAEQIAALQRGFGWAEDVAEGHEP